MSSFTTYMNRLCGQLFNSARPSVFSSFFFLSVCVQTTHHNKFRYPFVNLSFHCILLSKITPDTRLHPPHPACTLFLMSSLHHFILFVAALTFSFTNPLHLSSIRLSQTPIFYTYRFLKVLHLPNTVTSLVSEF